MIKKTPIFDQSPPRDPLGPVSKPKKDVHFFSEGPNFEVCSKLQNVLLLMVLGRRGFVLSKVIFGLILAITYISQIKVILGPL